MRAEWWKLDGSSQGLMKWTLGEESRRGSKMEMAKVKKKYYLVDYEEVLETHYE